MGKFEIRKMAPMLIATVEDSDDGQGFRTLAKYLGVMGEPQNESRTKISMTTPVITGEKIPMTTPVLSDKKRMAFHFPSEYTLENAPKPLDKRI